MRVIFSINIYLRPRNNRATWIHNQKIGSITKKDVYKARGTSWWALGMKEKNGLISIQLNGVVGIRMMKRVKKVVEQDKAKGVM